MNKFGRILTSLVLISMFLAACAPTTAPTPAVTVVEKVVNQTQVVAETTIVEQTKIVEKNVVVTATPVPVKAPDKIKLWAPGGSGTVADWNYDPVLQAVEQATNTQIEITFYDWGVFIDKLNTAAADGTFPDIVGVIDHTQSSLFSKWIDSGVLAAYEGDVATAAPNVIKEYQDDPTLAELKKGGKIYFQPVGWESGRAPNMGLFHVRKDLLDKYNMKPPDTFDEYFAYVKTCMQKGDGKGVIFTGGGGIGPAINGFAGGFGLPFRGWVKKDDGNYEYWAVQPGIKSALQLFRKMVADGLVDPASWSDTGGDASRSAYVSGTACSYIFNGGGHNGRIQSDMNLVKKGFQEWLLPALLNPATGKRGYTSEEMFWGVASIGGMKNNNPVAAARVINYLISTEGYKLTALGVAGRDYEETGGKITLLPQRTKDGFPTEMGDAGAHPLASGIVSWQPMLWQNFTLLYGKDKAFEDWYNQMWQNQIKYQIPTYGTSLASPKWSEFQATGEELISRAFLEAVKAKSDDEAGKIFDKFVTDWMGAGGKDASAEMNDLLKQTYK